MHNFINSLKQNKKQETYGNFPGVFGTIYRLESCDLAPWNPLALSIVFVIAAVTLFKNFVESDYEFSECIMV